MATKGILIIDDDPDFSNAVGAALRAEGFHIMVAPDGFTGLQALRAGYLPNLIILDVMLPDQDGLKFFDELKTNRIFANIPIVVVSSQESSRNFAWVARAEKPTSVEEIISKAKKYAR